jgi:hypothetical protein
MRRVELPPRAGVIAILIVLVLGGALLYIGANAWDGIEQARNARRLPGVATNVHCAHTRSSGCSGGFTSDDGRVHLDRVVVRGIDGDTHTVHGVLVRRIDTHGVITIQTDDTVYVHGDVDITGDYVTFGIFTAIGAIFALLGLLMVASVARHMIRDLRGQRSADE